jgi:hypothetical protein
MPHGGKTHKTSRRPEGMYRHSRRCSWSGSGLVRGDNTHLAVGVGTAGPTEGSSSHDVTT